MGEKVKGIVKVMHRWLLVKGLWATTHGALPEAIITDPEAALRDL